MFGGVLPRAYTPTVCVPQGAKVNINNKSSVKARLARSDEVLHDRIFKEKGAYTSAQMSCKLEADLRQRLTIPHSTPPTDLWGIRISAAAIECVCPRVVDTDYKDPNDAYQFVLHAIRCPVLKDSVPTELRDAFAATVEQEVHTF